LRSRVRRCVSEDAANVPVDMAEYHEYEIIWGGTSVSFVVDGVHVLEAAVAPQAPLALVLWIDNQYAALPPNGRLRFGSLETPAPVTLELWDVAVEGC